jgi:hypothetical protein
MNQYKISARIVGFFFLAAIFAYAFGNGLIESILEKPEYLKTLSSNRTQLAAGAVLMLVNSVCVVGIGILMFSILQTYNKTIAYTYLSFRIIESVTLAFGIISLLSLTTISEEFTKIGSPDNNPYFQTLSNLIMIFLGLGSLPFCYLLYQSKLIPRFLSAWGFIGYAIFLTGAILELFGFNFSLILSIPGGLFEVAFGIWLIVKGV